ncbi:MAG TPA: AI-2E family transporter [Stackebrandtia sp.]|uniref:AI-2E family transporter n=1 Tax=Stackebrandtia sp. TaxID=2023065 RepID=UPI002D2D1E65|nr:AI-2E family transporter [Stackebrandtia sp.]HZE38417.1 AI-2E family transporter [Stackebrandtia sp.]
MAGSGRLGRARQWWARLRANPYVERYEQAKHRNEEPEDLEELDEHDDGEPEPEPEPEPVPPVSDGVPNGIKVAAGWSWRALVIAAAVVGVLYLANMVSFVVIPVLIALLMSAIFQPLSALLARWHIPRSLAVTLVLVAGIAVVAGVLTWVVNQFIADINNLVTSVEQGLGKIQDWAKHGPLHLEQAEINSFFREIRTGLNKWVQQNQSDLAGSAVEGIGVVFSTLTGMFLTLFTTFFFMRDGRGIWTFIVRMLPEQSHEPLLNAGFAAWRSLVAFVRATIVVAFIDAIGIGIGLEILKVDLAIPLAALVFLGAFIPIIGATVSGAVAVLVALVGNDWVTALLVLAVVLLVQQLEGHVLQPLLMGRAVSIHPLAVVLAVGAGVVLAGPIGALIAVPLVAVINTGVKSLRAHARQAEEAARPPDEATGNVAT